MAKKKRVHHRPRHHHPKRWMFLGFALAEILIVVAIIGVVQVLLFTSWRGQVNKANDAKRKDDLANIKAAFEEYYNDYGCYPTQSVLATCGGSELMPYLAKTPCDPTTKKPYYYVPLDDNPCKGYRLLTTLDNKTDPDIARVSCSGPNACGFGTYNYGISAGTTVAAAGGGSGATYFYACSPQGTCNIYDDPGASGCPVTYTEGMCNNACGNPANRCAK